MVAHTFFTASSKSCFLAHGFFFRYLFMWPKIVFIGHKSGLHNRHASTLFLLFPNQTILCCMARCRTVLTLSDVCPHSYYHRQYAANPLIDAASFTFPFKHSAAIPDFVFEELFDFLLQNKLHNYYILNIVQHTVISYYLMKALTALPNKLRFENRSLARKRCFFTYTRSINKTASLQCQRNKRYGAGK